MEYRSKYKAEEIEAILDAKNNTGEGVDSNLDGLFTSQLQTKEVEVSEDTTIKADEGFLGLKEVSVKVGGGGGSASGSTWRYFDVTNVTDKGSLEMLAFMIKIEGSIISHAAIRNILLQTFPSIKEGIVAIGVTAYTMIVGGQTMNVDDATITETLNSLGATEITEEQFYAV